MTDGELLKGYERASHKCEYMLRAADRERVSLADIAARITRLGKLPGRSLRQAFGTTQAELISEAQIAAFARRHEIAMRKPKPQGVISSYCRGCFYLENQYKKNCEYILIEKKSRGCPAGDGCTRRILKRKEAG